MCEHKCERWIKKVNIYCDLKWFNGGTPTHHKLFKKKFETVSRVTLYIFFFYIILSSNQLSNNEILPDWSWGWGFTLTSLTCLLIVPADVICEIMKQLSNDKEVQALGMKKLLLRDSPEWTLQ